MADNDKEYAELRDILLWQGLNSQLLEMRNGGAAITDADQKEFQKFCFGTNLFQRLTEDPLIEELPISIITDFSRIPIVTLNNQTWISCLQTVLPGTTVLNLDLALSQAFDHLRTYEKKYFPRKDDPEENTDGDAELYHVINQYNELLEQQGRDLPEMLNNLYEMKSTAVSKALDEYDGRDCLVMNDEQFGLDLSKSSFREALADSYDQFCVSVLTMMDPTTIVLKDIQLVSFFDNQSAHPIKQSVSKFIEHERDIHARTYNMLDQFNSAVSTWHHSTEKRFIRICDPSPFAFLISPFPTV